MVPDSRPWGSVAWFPVQQPVDCRDHHKRVCVPLTRMLEHRRNPFLSSGKVLPWPRPVRNTVILLGLTPSRLNPASSNVPRCFRAGGGLCLPTPSYPPTPGPSFITGRFALLVLQRNSAFERNTPLGRSRGLSRQPPVSPSPRPCFRLQPCVVAVP